MQLLCTKCGKAIAGEDFDLARGAPRCAKRTNGAPIAASPTFFFLFSS